MLLSERNPLVPARRSSRLWQDWPCSPSVPSHSARWGWALRRFLTTPLRPLTKFLTEILMPFWHYWASCFYTLWLRLCTLFALRSTS
jgi:hypothetical protein